MEKVLVVIPNKYRGFLDEELSLVKTIYSDVVDIITIRKPNPKYYVTLNKLENIKNKAEIDKIIVMDRLKPTQLINLVRETGKEVIDRVLLILEIFDRHAGSREAKLQIELAKLKHQLPLIREAIRYAKLGELHGFLGAGRYGYEKYYTMLRMKEARIKREIEEIRRARNITRIRRVKLGYPHIAIIGYTCAGKTTLFNKLTYSNKPVGPEPFTTLSPKASRVLFNGIQAIVIDTVGFIRDLPHEIIEAFYATLEETSYSDILIHVVDISKPLKHVVREVIEARRILSAIGVQGKPIILALNKIDLVDDYEEKIKIISSIKQVNEYLIPISAKKGVNLDILRNTIASLLRGVAFAENIRT
ncbi:MAG: GTPase HflX [Thermoprotei archaeon]